MLKKAVTTMLIVFSLQACSSIEVIHADLELPCVPEHGVYFAPGETDVMSDELYNKFKKIILTYKQRIKSQCELADKHNELHSGDE